MSRLMSSVSRSPKFWLAVVFFLLPLASAALLDGSAEVAPGAERTGAPVFDQPWVAAPLDATTDGTLIVRKVAYPRDTAETFTFTGDVAGTIPNGGTLVVTDVPAPGTYSSTESVLPGWYLNSIQCDDGTNQYGPTATFNLGIAQTLQCSFYNQENGSEPCRDDTGRWPYGPTYAVAVDGVAYMGSGAALVSFDVGAPTAPTQLDAVDLSGGPVEGVTVRGGMAYVTTGTLGYGGSLVIVDISNPSSMQQRGSVLLDEPRRVEVEGTYAHVAGAGGLTVVDVSDVDSPSTVGGLSLPGYAHDLAVDAGLVYEVNGYNGLRIIDVSTPSLPVEIGNLALPGQPLGVDLEGQTLYVACFDGGLRIIDVSNPAVPVEIGYVFTDRPSDVDVVGPLAYVADDWWGIKVLDVANPVAPVLVGELPVYGSSRDIVVDSGLAYMAATRSGLQIIDVSVASAPVNVGGHDFPDEASDADLIGSYAYLSLGYEGDILVLDVSDPSAPQESLYFNTMWSVEQLQPAGSYAYVAAGGSGLRVLDVSDPAMPVDVGGVDTPGWGTGVAVRGDHAFLADSNGGLRVMDIATPWSPAEIGSASTPSYARAVVANASHAFVATSSSGIRVFDISNPASPHEVGAATPTGSFQAMALRGDHLYVTGNRGLRVLDISSPAAPQEVAFYDGYINGTDLVLEGPFAHVVSGWELVTYDISDPIAPILVRRTPLLSSPVAIGAGRGRLLVTQSEISVEITSPCGLVFADDFETGDTAIWSQSLP